MSDKLSEEDKALFREAVKQVKPLKKRALTEKSSAKPQPPASKKTFIEQKPTHQTRFLSDFIAEEVQSDSVLSYCQSDFPKKRMQDLIRGKIRWQAKLDLHGLRVGDVEMQLTAFIDKHYAQGTHSLLIIHGKASHRHESPILKNLVNRYLPQFEEVLAFHSALPKDGGSGAVYVLLKKQRC